MARVFNKSARRRGRRPFHTKPAPNIQLELIVKNRRHTVALAKGSAAGDLVLS